jgi:Family of unknown function (DUF6284)
MATHAGTAPEDDEPSAEDLAAIERESGLISAEPALLDAEIRILSAEGDPSAVDWQRLRRAVREVLRESAELYADDRPSPDTDSQSPGQDAA